MRSHITPGTVLVAGVVLAAGLVTGSAASAAARSPASAAPGDCTNWQIVTAPQPPPGFTAPYPEGNADTDLTGVSVLSGNDVWIGGGNWDNTGTQSWFVHWNGRSATTAVQPSLIPNAVPRFNLFPPDNYPPSSSFDSDSDGWQLLGLYEGIPYYFDPQLPKAEHWQDGRWVLTPMAEAPASDLETEAPWLYSVAAVSPDDAWAVGSLYEVGNGLFGVTADGAVIEHWNGTSWSIVPSPAQSQSGAVLQTISVVSPSDIWAVGHQGNASQTSYTGETPLIEHWDGHTWSVVPAPATGTLSFLFAVSGDSPSDAWAVGYQEAVGASAMSPLVEHWNGSSWSVVSLPADVSATNGLTGVYAASPDDVWATVGSANGPLSDPDLPDGTRPPVFVHWDGTAWSTVATPGPRAYGLAYQYEAIGGHGTDVWAVGAAAEAYDAGSGFHGYLPLIANLNCGNGTGHA
jgi:hypothetical protein